MPHQKQKNLLDQVCTILIPEEYLENFEVTHIENNTGEWVIELVEKKDRIPHELEGKEVVCDGFCNSIDILTHAFSLKKIYLRLYRRRWKAQGSTTGYANEYNLHQSGMKTTREFQDFLREMVDERLLSYTTIGEMLSINPETIYRWYHKYING